MSGSTQSRARPSRRTAGVLVAATALLASACGGPSAATTGPGRVDLPVEGGAEKGGRKAEGPKRASPPPSGAAKESPFPATLRSKLANGMGVDVVPIKSLPVVQVRLLVRAGAGYGSPGVGELTALLLKDGGTRSMPAGEVLRRVETLGSDLIVRSEPDATVIGLALTKDKAAEGMALLAQVAREPRFDGEELRKLKSRRADEVADLLRSNGSWAATWLAFHEVFPDKHPYQLQSALPSQIAKVDGAQIRDFHRRFFVPKNATLVIAGDIEEAAAKELAQKHFGSWAGGEPPKVEFPPPRPIDKRRVLLAHRPKSVQSDVLVGLLAPDRKAERWAQVRVANQILGGGVASRLFSDVREQRSLAYSTSSRIYELGHGDQPLVLYAGTESGKTAKAVTGLLENVERMKSSPPSAVETETARRFLSDVFAIRMETIGAIAEMVVTQETFGLADDYWDTYRKQVRATEAKDAGDMAGKLFGSAPGLVIVAGDADVVGPQLASFGEAAVFDPEKEFKRVETTGSKGATP